MKRLVAERVRNVFDYSNGRRFAQHRRTSAGYTTVPFIVVIRHLLTPNQ